MWMWRHSDVEQLNSSKVSLRDCYDQGQPGVVVLICVAMMAAWASGSTRAGNIIAWHSLRMLG